MNYFWLKKQKGLAPVVMLVVLGVLSVVVPLTTKLVEQNQESRSEAMIVEDGAGGGVASSTCSGSYPRCSGDKTKKLICSNNRESSVSCLYGCVVESGVSKCKAKCGRAESVSWSTKPNSDLCSLGKAGTVSEVASGWKWTCGGSTDSNYSVVICNTEKKITSSGAMSTSTVDSRCTDKAAGSYCVKGDLIVCDGSGKLTKETKDSSTCPKCGGAISGKTTLAPENNLCARGESSWTDEFGSKDLTFNWTCKLGNFSESCESKRNDFCECGEATKTLSLVQPTENLCITGTSAASLRKLNDKNEWEWGCYAKDVCSYVRCTVGRLESIPLTNIKLSAASANLHYGDSQKLTVTFEPENTTDDKKITWSSNSKLVTVDSNGLIKVVGEVSQPTEVTITATAVNNIAMKMTVRVLAKIYNVSSCSNLSPPRQSLNPSICGLSESDADNGNTCCGAECKTCGNSKYGATRCYQSGNDYYVEVCGCIGSWGNKTKCASGLVCNSAATACVKPENMEVTYKCGDDWTSETWQGNMKVKSIDCDNGCDSTTGGCKCRGDGRDWGENAAVCFNNIEYICKTSVSKSEGDLEKVEECGDRGCGADGKCNSSVSGLKAGSVCNNSSYQQTCNNGKLNKCNSGGVVEEILCVTGACSNVTSTQCTNVNEVGAACTDYFKGKCISALKSSYYCKNGVITKKDCGELGCNEASNDCQTVVPISDIKLSSTSMALYSGETHEVIVSVLPEGAIGDKTVVWSGGNEVVTVTDKGGGKFWLTVPKSVNKSESMTLTAKVGNISKTVTVKVYRGKVYSGSSCYDLSTPKINLSQSDCGLTEDDRDFNNKVCCGAECKTCDDNGKSVKMGTIRCLNEGNRSYVQSCQCQGTWSTAQNCATGLVCNSTGTACVKAENVEDTFFCKTDSDCNDNQFCDDESKKCVDDLEVGDDCKRNEQCGAGIGGTCERWKCVRPGYCMYDVNWDQRVFNTSVCVGGIEYTCNNAGGSTGWKNYTTRKCESGCNADGTKCVDLVCAEGEKKCDGNILKTCNATRTGWNDNQCNYGCDSDKKLCKGKCGMVDVNDLARCLEGIPSTPTPDTGWTKWSWTCGDDISFTKVNCESDISAEVRVAALARANCLAGKCDVCSEIDCSSKDNKFCLWDPATKKCISKSTDFVSGAGSCIDGFWPFVTTYDNGDGHCFPSGFLGLGKPQVKECNNGVWDFVETCESGKCKDNKCVQIDGGTCDDGTDCVSGKCIGNKCVSQKSNCNSYGGETGCKNGNICKNYSGIYLCTSTCGGSNKETLDIGKTSKDLRLCPEGDTTSDLSYDKSAAKWTWTCSGDNFVQKSEGCWALLKVAGDCQSEDKSISIKDVTTITGEGMCAEGNIFKSKGINAVYRYAWTCEGKNGGSTADDCLANVTYLNTGEECDVKKPEYCLSRKCVEGKCVELNSDCYIDGNGKSYGCSTDQSCKQTKIIDAGRTKVFECVNAKGKCAEELESKTFSKKPTYSEACVEGSTPEFDSDYEDRENYAWRCKGTDGSYSGWCLGKKAEVNYDCSTFTTDDDCELTNNKTSCLWYSNQCYTSCSNSSSNCSSDKYCDQLGNTAAFVCLPKKILGSSCTVGLNNDQCVSGSKCLNNYCVPEDADCYVVDGKTLVGCNNNKICRFIQTDMWESAYKCVTDAGCGVKETESFYTKEEIKKPCSSGKLLGDKISLDEINHQFSWYCNSEDEGNPIKCSALQSFKGVCNEKYKGKILGKEEVDSITDWCTIGTLGEVTKTEKTRTWTCEGQGKDSKDTGVVYFSNYCWYANKWQALVGDIGVGILEAGWLNGGRQDTVLAKGEEKYLCTTDGWKKSVDGVCADNTGESVSFENRRSSYTIPLGLSSLCKQGGNENTKAIEDLNNHSFYWVCEGINRGENSEICWVKKKIKSSCNININGKFNLSEVPKKETLCTDGGKVIGFDGSVDKEGKFSWSCEGINGGVGEENCQAGVFSKCKTAIGERISLGVKKSGLLKDGILEVGDIDYVCTETGWQALYGKCGDLQNKYINSKPDKSDVSLCNYGNSTDINESDDKKAYIWYCLGANEAKSQTNKCTAYKKIKIGNKGCSDNGKEVDNRCVDGAKCLNDYCVSSGDECYTVDNLLIGCADKKNPACVKNDSGKFVCISRGKCGASAKGGNFKDEEALKAAGPCDAGLLLSTSLSLDKELHIFSWQCVDVDTYGNRFLGGASQFDSCTANQITNGVCNEKTLATKFGDSLTNKRPIEDQLCQDGTKVNKISYAGFDLVGKDGKFNWTCGGVNGGADKLCSVERQKSNLSCSAFVFSGDCNNSFNNVSCFWENGKCVEECLPVVNNQCLVSDLGARFRECTKNSSGKYFWRETSCTVNQNCKVDGGCVDKKDVGGVCGENIDCLSGTCLLPAGFCIGKISNCYLDSNSKSYGCDTDQRCQQKGSVFECVTDAGCGVDKDDSFMSLEDLKKNNLCSPGELRNNDVWLNTTNNQFNWYCDSVDDGNSKYCTTNQMVSGSCNESLNGKVVTAKPINNLCTFTQDIPTVTTTVDSNTGVTTYTWTCTGKNTGGAVICQAKQLLSIGSNCVGDAKNCFSNKCIGGYCVDLNSVCYLDSNSKSYGCDTDQRCKQTGIIDGGRTKVFGCVTDAGCGVKETESFYTKEEIAIPCRPGAKTEIKLVGDKFTWTCNSDDGGDSKGCTANQKFLNLGESGCGDGSKTCAGGTVCVSNYCVPTGSDCYPSMVGCENGQSCLKLNSNSDIYTCVIKGDCGNETNGKSFYTTAELVDKGLCNSGRAQPLNPIVMENKFDWKCLATDKNDRLTVMRSEEIDDSCSATQKIDGVCNPDRDGHTVTFLPSNDLLCSVGNPIWIDNEGKDGKFNWQCSGFNNGDPDDCEATFNKVEAKLKISLSLTFAGVMPGAQCVADLEKLNLVIVKNLGTGVTQLITEPKLTLAVGQTNTIGEQVWTTVIEVDGKFSGMNNNNQLRIRSDRGLGRIMCVNNQNQYQIENCNLNLSRNSSYSFINYGLILGDVNNDGKINTVDMSAIKSKAEEMGGIRCGQKEDLNLDGLVNAVDMGIIMNRLDQVGEF